MEFARMVSFLAWKLAQQFFYTTCTVLTLLVFRFLSVDVAPRGELDDDLAIVLIVSAFMGACLSWYFGVVALGLQAANKCCLHIEENVCVLTNTLGGQPSQANTSTKDKQAQQDQNVGSILDALTTVLEDSCCPDFDDETNKVWDILRFWENKMLLSFDDEEKVVLTKLVLNLVAPRLRVVLSEFVNSRAFDNSKTTHVDVANILACFKQNQESSTEQNSCEATQDNGHTSRHTRWGDCIEKAKEYQEVLESVKLANTGIANTGYTYQVDDTYEKIKDLSEWLEMFDPADRDVLFKTIHHLLKPSLVCVLSWFVESRMFRTFDAKHAKALKVFEQLQSFESPACCDKYKLEKVIEHIFELMAASNLDPSTFGDWAPSHNHPKLALLEHALAQPTCSNQPGCFNQACQTFATQPDQAGQTFATQPDQAGQTFATQPDQAQADQGVTIPDLLTQFQAEALMIRVLCSLSNPRLSEDAFTWQEVRTKTSIHEIRENNMMAFLKAKATREVYLYSTRHGVVLAV